MRPNLKDVMALLEGVPEGGTFGVTIEQKGWFINAEDGPYSMGRDRRKSVRKAIDAAERDFNGKRQENKTTSGGEDNETE